MITKALPIPRWTRLSSRVRGCGPLGWRSSSTRSVSEVRSLQSSRPATGPSSDHLQIQARPVLCPFTGHGVDVAFPHHEVRIALDLDLQLFLGVEQHSVAHLDVTYVVTHSQDIAPGQPSRDLRG